MIKKYGEKYVLDASTSPYDPMANALMGAEFIKENTKALSGVRDNVGMTDLYMAHFLGAGGAKKLFSARPDEFAAAIMPAEARANKSIFFNSDGSPKTVSEVYNTMQQRLVKKAESFGFSSDTTEEDKRKSAIASAKSSVNQMSNNVAGLTPANNYSTTSAVTAVVDDPKTKVIKDSIANPTGTGNAPAVASSNSTANTFKAKDSIVAAESITNNRDTLKADIPDYKLNLSNIETILSNSYTVQVGIKQSLDMLVNHTLTKEEMNKTPQAANNTALDIPAPTVDLAKKRYDIS